MRTVRGIESGRTVYGIVQGDQLACLTGAPWLGGERTGEMLPLAECRLLAPTEPTKVVAVGLNYRDHIEEMGDRTPQDPVLFIKPSTAVIGPDEAIRCPAMSERVDYEAELAVVIGAPMKDVAPEEVPRYIFGYTCANDVTARDLQPKDIQWTRAKSFDTFAPLGPWIETEFDPADVGVCARVNGETRQQSRTRYLIHSVPELLSYISRVMTLLPGDVVLTGTPAGIGQIRGGDRVEIEVEGIGVLSNPVEDAR